MPRIDDREVIAVQHLEHLVEVVAD